MDEKFWHLHQLFDVSSDKKKNQKYFLNCELFLCRDIIIYEIPEKNHQQIDRSVFELTMNNDDKNKIIQNVSYLITSDDRRRNWESGHCESARS